MLTGVSRLMACAFAQFGIWGIGTIVFVWDVLGISGTPTPRTVNKKQVNQRSILSRR